MPAPPARDVTELLLAWGAGDHAALDALVPLVYAELHRLARIYMRGERQGRTLQTTALVNEAYLRLIDASRVRWQNRAHFLAVSAQLMRRILVDAARARGSLKRGGDVVRVPLDDELPVFSERGDDLVAVDEALTALAAVDRRKGQVVELRYFGGLSVEETAEVLKVSVDTVMRDWKLARLWLHRELGRGRGTDAVEA
ncbi:MAG: sigma-70 family RNA polymerase sigma factor [Planctomycetes bacterium]|nr:sigma-70 family RNA polymerase sigma factor [Planctomycetota bacterium]